MKMPVFWHNRLMLKAACLSILMIVVYLVLLRSPLIHQDPTEQYDTAVGERTSTAKSGQRDTCDWCNQTAAAQPALANTSKTRKQGCSRKLPQALLIGVKKCGTVATKFFMRRHPGVIYAAGEDNFFGLPGAGPDLEACRKKMGCSRPGQLTMQGSQAYFLLKEAPRQIKEALPDVKLILLLRDPVSRAVSDYLQLLSMEDKYGPPRGLEASVNRSEIKDGTRDEYQSSFEESVLHPNGSLKTYNLLLVRGQYADFLPRWLEHFPLERILILDGSAFAKDPFPALKQMEEFLAIPPYFERSHFTFNEQKGFYCSNQPTPNTCMGNNKGRPHPKVNETVIRMLQEYFDPFNRQLNAMLNRTFPWST